MLDPNQFDKAIKAAEKLETILKRSQTLRSLSGIETGLRSIRLATEQADRLLRRTRMISKESEALAYKQAGITKETYRRVKLYDKELDIVRRQRVELQRSAQAELQRALSVNTAAKDVATNDLARHKSLQQLLIKEYNARAAAGESATELATVSDEINVHLAETSKLQNTLRRLEREKLNIENSRTKELKKITKELAEQDKIEQATIALRAADKAHMKQLQKQNFKEFLGEKLGGGMVGQFKQFVTGLTGLGKLLSVVAIFALLLKSVVGSYRDALKATIDLGLDATQRTDEILNAQKVVAEAAKRKALISIEDAIKAKGALIETFGTLDISNDLVTKSAELTRQLGLSAEEAASIFDLFTRIRGESAAAAASNAVLVKATALANRANPALVMRDVAMNAANFAKSGRASADELARASIMVRRMGVDLGTIANIADNLVSNFEGALEAQATIGAFAPGFDQTGLMIASQFGTDADIARELKNAVNSIGTDFDSLPRSFKLSIASGMGLSVEQLAKIANSTTDALTTVSPDAEYVAKANANGLNEMQQVIVDPLKSIERGVFGIWSLLTGVLGKGKSEPTQLPDKVRSFDVGGLIGGTDGKSYRSLKDLFGSLKSDELPAILHRGEAVLNKTQMNILSRLTDVQSSIGKSVSDFVGTFTEKFSSKGGILSKVTGLFGGSGGTSGILSKISGSNGILGTITKSVSGSTGILGKVSGLLSGGIKEKAAGLLGKIPGIGGLAGSLLGGGGIKAAGSSLLKSGAGKLIGGAIGSIIPGAGTVVGSLVGGLVSKGIGKIVNSKIGKAVGGFLGKSPVGKVAGKAIGGIGKAFGGLFGKKKKPAVVQSDYSQQAGMAGTLNYGGQISSNNYQSGISFPPGYVPSNMTSMQQTSSGMGDTKALEAKFDILINLLKSGAIGINMDGKKVSDSLVDANRYG